MADTEPNERFSLYTRGNVGEVFPHVITALTGTLIGEAVRRGEVEVGKPRLNRQWFSEVIGGGEAVVRFTTMWAVRESNP